MKVQSKTNTNQENRLTVGKWYDVIEESLNTCRIIDDESNVTLWSKSWFYTTSELRERKLIQLGI